MLCQHGPNAKCIHCLDNEFITDAAHISFDNWLAERKLKCKGVHPSDVKCNNCLPPSQMRYEVDLTCKKHEPYPKAMCNKCIPPNVIVKSQEFRHVDYVQFMNIAQIQNFVSYWLPRSHEQQRVGFLYGYYAEDPNYKGGIRVIVEALYEPKQKGTYSDFEILEHEEGPALNAVTTGLTLERVGWIFTDSNHDVVMSAKHARMAAKFQEQYKVPHESGYDISNFITVILRPDEKNPNDIKPEVYMISDQGQAI
jgi:nuclear protein localization protein 4 homolog